MQNIAENPPIFNHFSTQSQGKRQHRRKFQTLSTIITTSKAEQGFIVAVSLYRRRTRIASDLRHIKDCPSAERAFWEGYKRAQVLAEDYPLDTRLYIGNQNHKGGTS